MKKNSVVIDHYGHHKFWLEIAPHSMSPSVLDFEDEEIRNNLINPDEVVVQDEEIALVLTYPLSVEVKIPLQKKGGFTRLDAYKAIYEAYKKIYQEEERAVGDPGTYENLYNRRESTGPYGIWGHYLEDLLVESVSYDPRKKELHAFIGS